MSRVLSAVPGLVLVAGCSFGGASDVPTDELEELISEGLEEEAGFPPESVDCPDELPAEEGAEVRCSLTHGGVTLGITVTATEIEGSEVHFGYVVDEEPES